MGLGCPLEVVLTCGATAALGVPLGFGLADVRVVVFVGLAAVDVVFFGIIYMFFSQLGE